MTTSGAQADAFFREVIDEGAVWAIRDEQGFPAPVGTDGRRAMPFWSLRSRAEAVIASADAYRTFVPDRIALMAWRREWLPGLSRDGLDVGLNWSGDRVTGYDVPADSVEARLASVDPP